MKILHTADLHLGKKGREEDIFKQWEKVVDISKNGVDIVIIAGDVFDDGKVSEKIITRFSKSLEELTKSGVDVFIIPGNHDIKGGNPLREIKVLGVDILFNYKVIEFEDIAIHFFPFSFDLFGPKMRELKKDVKCKYEIGVCHGSYVNMIDIFSDLGDEEAIYCPLVKEDIEALGFDYLALGHYHNARLWKVGKTQCAYCGSIEPLSFKEVEERQVYIVCCGSDLRVETLKIGCQRPYITKRWKLGLDIDEKEFEDRLRALAKDVSPSFFRLILHGLAKNKSVLKDVGIRAKEFFQTHGTVFELFDETVDLSWIKEHYLGNLFYEICKEKAKEDPALWQRVFYRGITLLRQFCDVD